MEEDDEPEEENLEEKVDALQEEQKLKRVEVTAIEFDWVFRGPRAKKFVKFLGETDNLDLFLIPTINAVVMYQWQFFKPAIIKKIFFPFLIYLSMFMLYANYFLTKKLEERDQDLANGVERFGTW